MSTPRPYFPNCHCKPQPPLYTGSFNFHIQIPPHKTVLSSSSQNEPLLDFASQTRSPFPPFLLCLVALLSHIQLSVAPWTVACQAPPSMRVYKQEYWTERVAVSYPRESSGPWIEPMPLAFPALASGFFTLVAQLVKHAPAMWVT